MGFMDKAKQAAMQAKESAQHVAQQGQAKVASVQESRNVGELYRNLGEAVYEAQRRGGDAAAVEAAMTALDQHFAGAPAAAPADGGAASGPAAAGPAAAQTGPAAAETGSAPQPGYAPQPGSATQPGAEVPPAAAPPAAPPAGNFTLDDL
jgi:putative membrane protein